MTGIIYLIIGSDDKKKAAFEYLSEKNLVKRISEIERKEGDGIYFTYYRLEDTEQTEQLLESDISSLYAVDVTNNFLDSYYEPYGIRCVSREYLENLAYYLDVISMNIYFDQVQRTGTDEDKAELAEAFMQLFGQMCYDYACDKFSYEGLKEILPVVEKIEALQGETLWELRGDAYMNLMDAAVENDQNRIQEYGTLCVEAFKKYILETGLEYRSCQKLSRAYHLLADHDDINCYNYWQNALTSIKQAVKQDPEQVEWLYYLQLLYTPLAKDWDTIALVLRNERHEFRALVESLQLIPGLYYRVASSFQRMRHGYLEMGFPEVYEDSDDDYLFWLDKSLEREAAIDHDFPELLDAAHFYLREGSIYNRIDLLERALEYYEYQRVVEPGSGFVVYYAAKALECIGDYYSKKGETDKAGEHMSKALNYYYDHEEIVLSNYSSLSHYCEFLERCYSYKGKTEKPSIEKIRSIAKLTEKEGKGYYSTPFIVQARMALAEKNEALAVFQLERTLLLHELCVDNVILEFANEYKRKGFVALDTFLETVLLFMEEVQNGYYYNPELRWPEIEKMNMAEVKEAWENRMRVIRSRGVAGS